MAVPGLQCINDPIMGRCFEAKQGFESGACVLTDISFIYSSYDGINGKDSHLFKAAYPKSVRGMVSEIIDDLSSLDRCSSHDTARNFLILLAIEILRDQNKVSELSDWLLKTGAPTESMGILFSLLDALGAANIKECVADIKSFRKEYPKVIPKSFTNERAARLLGLLNTNQIELEELGGSGLFVTAAIVQHDCNPTCSYTTMGNRLVLTAIREIALGDRISIDYGNHFYHATADRIEHLQDSYGFTCDCEKCQGPDLYRAFRCASCAQGLVHPHGNGDDASVGWMCTTCRAQAEPACIEAWLSTEAEIKTTPPQTLEAIEAVISETPIAEQHCLIFWAYNDLSLTLSAEARSSYFPTGGRAEHSADELYGRALAALEKAVRLLDMQLPPVHHERVVYFDRLGQLAVAAGNHSLAQQSFRMAHENSQKCSGADAPATLALLTLATHTPTTLVDLLEHYGKSSGSEGVAASVDDRQEWEDIEDD